MDRTIDRTSLYQKWEPMTTFYSFARFCTGRYAGLIANVKVLGLENVPLEGPLIVAANHLCFYDPPLVGGLFPRQVHFMAKKELSWGPFVLLMNGLTTFPVTRGTPDRKAIATALDYLKNGKVVGIFPQGTRVRSGGIENAEMGLSLIADKAQVPVIPIGLYYTNAGAYFPGMGSAVCMNVGPALTMEKVSREHRKENMERFTGQVMEAIGGLIEGGRRELESGGKPA